MTSTNGDKKTKIHNVVSHEDWLKARQELLVEEKEFSRKKLELAKKRQELPWEKLDKDYEFECPTKGKVKLSELFGEKHSSLVVEHFMFKGGEGNGCSLCCFFLDGVNGFYEHLTQRVSFAAVAIGPAEDLGRIGKTKGWKFPLLSSKGTTFNADFGVGFTKEELESNKAVYNYTGTFSYDTQAPGISVFKKTEDGTIYHTYSVYAAGLADFHAMFAFLDAVPEGRDEVGEGKRNMWWVKHKEDY